MSAHEEPGIVSAKKIIAGLVESARKSGRSVLAVELEFSRDWVTDEVLALLRDDWTLTDSIE